jgi:hypothetical protein
LEKITAHIQNWQTVTFRRRGETVKRLVYTRIVQPWYRQKLAPSFADALSCLRRELWRERIKYMFGISAVHDKKFEFLLDALAPSA